MKKRLLSAALALAMVLTLIPATVVPASAAEASSSAPESGKTTVQWVNGTDYTKQKADKTYVSNEWAWQYKDAADGKTYWAGSTSLSGIVNGVSANGVFYNSLTKTDASGNTVLNTTSFTLTSNQTLSGLGTATSLSINTFGSALTISASLNTVNSLTVTDTAYTQYGKERGTIKDVTRNVGNYTQGTPATNMSASGMTLNVTGAGIGRISLTGRANTVTLTDVAVDGITLDGTTNVNNTAAPTVTTTTCERQSLTINPKSTAPYTPSELTGNITVTGNNSTVALNGTSGISGNIKVTSTGGSVKIDNGSNVGAITVASNDDKVTDAPPTVTIDGGTAAGISYSLGRTSTAASSFIVNANGKVTGTISTESGTVAIHSGNVSDVAVKLGTLTIDGASGTVGSVTLGDENKPGKTTLNFSGTGYDVGNINLASGTLTIGNSWPADRSNTFGELDLTGYTGQGIKGGIFGTEADDAKKAAWFSPDLQFIRGASNGKYAYYGKKELSTAIAQAGSDAKTEGILVVMGASASSYVGFYNTSADSDPVALLGYGALTGIYLPDMINGTPVATWTEAAQVKNYSVNEEVPLATNADATSASPIKMVIQSSGAAVGKLTNAAANGDNNPNVTVTLSNNQIILSGAVGQDAYAGIKIELTTDQMNSNGTPVKFNVAVAYDTTNKTAGFSTIGQAAPPTGVTVNKNSIVVGNNTYTLVTSGLAKPAGSLKVAGIDTISGITGKSIVATINASMGSTAKAALATAIAGPASGKNGAEFGWTDSPAMKQAVNLAWATITNPTQVENWQTAAQRAAWNLDNKGKTPDDTDLAGTGYDTVVLEPYLAVTVSAYNESGVMTANLLPSYRVIVVKSTNSYTTSKGANGFTAEGYYIAQAGRALDTPINDLTDSSGDKGVTVTFHSLPTGFGTSTVMHQDDTYAYTTNNKGSYVITHAGKAGLGTVVFNTTPALVTMERKEGAANVGTGKVGTYGYDNLQAAVDDTLPQSTDDVLDEITVTADYKGSGMIDVSGLARKFTVVTKGNTDITRANNNFTVDVSATGHTYTVQLQKDIAPTGGNITVTSATGGTASANPNPATAGQTVTVTLSASAGYTPSGVTVKDSSGKAISVSGSGSSYSFTMPAGSVAVTPSFTQTQTTVNPTLYVNNASQGSAVAKVGAAQVASGTQLTPGSTVIVTTAPASGQRTMGLNVAGATAYRTGVNTFQLTMPSGGSSVNVTPIFDRDNGTNFEDVWTTGATQYCSNAVGWAVNNDITTGTSTYTFSPNDTCTRAQMVTFLWRAAGRPSVAGVSNPFVDVSSSLTPGDYYPAILWAVSKGITQGVDRTHFAPNNTVTRGQAVTFLYRFENSPAASTNSGFYDVPSSQFYARAVSWAAGKGVTNGTTATTFGPNSACTRGQIVTFLYRDRTGNLV